MDSQISRQLEERRKEMVRRQLRPRGINDEAVLNAMGKVPREKFLPEDMVQSAYLNSALPIDEGQTISQPLVVAMMTQLLEVKSRDRILEIGTGSGYQTAVLAEIALEVFTVELLPSLAVTAKGRLEGMGYSNIHFRTGDGTLGWKESAPYDGILVAAGGPKVPESLLAQLAVGGRLVIPVGLELEFQELIRVRRTSPLEFKKENLGPVKFVPLLGQEGWNPV
jgi:protein-L-isoaspartate(D-aspartate) O-methyltransferase